MYTHTYIPIQIRYDSPRQRNIYIYKNGNENNVECQEWPQKYDLKIAFRNSLYGILGEIKWVNKLDV